MRRANLQLLTYLAQVRQPLCKNAWLLTHPASITRLSLLTKNNKRYGQSHKEIVITGTVRDAVWVGQNKSTGVWLQVVGGLPKRSLYFL